MESNQTETQFMARSKLAQRIKYQTKFTLLEGPNNEQMRRMVQREQILVWLFRFLSLIILIITLNFRSWILKAFE
jgi:hypothetical protein